MTSLEMASSNNVETSKKVAASALAAAFILGNLATVEPAQAVDDSMFGSSNVVAARSGGRAGGRSSSARMSSPRPSSSSSSRSTTVINRTYVTQPTYSSPSVIMAPSYSPFPGLGLGLGLNAVNQIGNDMRDYRQEREIQDTRSELSASRAREAQMEARLRQLEAGQGTQQMTQQQLQMQQQMLLQQQAATNAAAAAAAAAK
eukprot:CAMPEP_0197173510 /NCGR_PEP_ID=MMETSP1423-20130617/411_1 /TAXON_ID=476441 /ORGANISM="Pseudo-nitzschia heimii, Strain UNC1101" /LENGTH=201 /DNA_ID=CAMNT_0042622335 /DNA_START=145 /DNA_END=750 /DNA_ORIENTATION=+